MPLLGMCTRGVNCCLAQVKSYDDTIPASAALLLRAARHEEAVNKCTPSALNRSALRFPSEDVQVMISGLNS